MEFGGNDDFLALSGVLAMHEDMSWEDTFRLVLREISIGINDKIETGDADEGVDNFFSDWISENHIMNKINAKHANQSPRHGSK